MDDGQQHSEATPLLRPSSPSPSLAPSASSALRVPHVWQTVVSVAAVVLTLSIGSHITLVAQTSILQDIICQEYYTRENSPYLLDDGSRRCNIEPIQSEVAYINGWKDVSEMLPAILVVIPFGVLADRAGRKKVLILSIIGLLINDLWIRLIYAFPSVIPVRMVWLAGLWQIIGAGSPGLSSISYVLIADVCPPEQRTTAFSQLGVASMVSQLIFVAAGGALAEINAWIPMWISLVFTVMGLLISVYFVPETLPSVTANQSHHQPRLDISANKGNHGSRARLHHHLRPFITQLVNFSHWMRKNTLTVLVVSCFFVYYLGTQTNGHLLLQYASARLGWSLSKASYLISLGAAVHMAVLLLFIPALSSLLLRFHIHELVKDKRIAQISGIFLLIGSGTLFYASSWVFLVIGQVLVSLGSGFTIPARSVVTGMVEQEHLGSLYTALSVLTYGGILVGGPLFADAFHRGMQLGDIWMGMPFLISGVCYLFAFFAISASAIRPGHQEIEHSVDGIDGISQPEAESSQRV